MTGQGPRRVAFGEERGQFRLLFRAFLQRLFESDLLPDTADPRLLAVWLAAALASPPAFFALRLWTLYGPGMTDAGWPLPLRCSTTTRSSRRSGS